ncbi:hypothetical protein MUK42_27642 [Musa troglodytarum]|uniref:Uncharacterized protein n=1 Tax=Musa troglodytarum TaxID=320322 RepID=A0A9E7F5W7_9LILI|nr:hypothetical protein MUK42_27642 [Musa troglodytarum]
MNKETKRNLNISNRGQETSRTKVGDEERSRRQVVSAVRRANCRGTAARRGRPSYGLRLCRQLRRVPRNFGSRTGDLITDRASDGSARLESQTLRPSAQPQPSRSVIGAPDPVRQRRRETRRQGQAATREACAASSRPVPRSRAGKSSGDPPRVGSVLKIR